MISHLFSVCCGVVDLEVEALRRLTQDEVVAFFDRHIRVNSAARKKLSIQVFGNKHAFAAGLSTTPPPAVTDKKKPEAEPKDEDSEDETDKAAEASKPKDGAAAAAKEPAKPLPPVPVDNATLVPLTDYIAFKKSMPLYPNLV